MHRSGRRTLAISSRGGGGWDNNTFCYNLLGDPELTIRRKTVQRFHLIASLAALNAGTLVKVSDAQGNTTPGGFVNVTLADGRMLGPVTKLGQRKIDADAAYALVREKYGQKAADASVQRKVAQKWIEDALKEAGVP